MNNKIKVALTKPTTRTILVGIRHKDIEDSAITHILDTILSDEGLVLTYTLGKEVREPCIVTNIVLELNNVYLKIQINGSSINSFDKFVGVNKELLTLEDESGRVGNPKLMGTVVLDHTDVDEPMDKLTDSLSVPEPVSFPKLIFAGLIILATVTGWAVLNINLGS